MNEHRSEVERAALNRKFYDAMGGGHGMFTADYVFDILSAAGLLRTEADRLNAELADKVLWYCARHLPDFKATWSGADGQVFLEAARAVHEHRNPKPVERWTLGRDGQSFWADKDGRHEWAFPQDAEPEARAYVARKNAEAK